MAQPTPETYAELQAAFDHFNQVLFDGALPPCLITLQRERNTDGYYSNSRFVGRASGELVDEIAMNPAYFAIRPIRETLQTLVHEMVHQWQAHFGKPGRGRYHNREWADKMEAIGLMPSDTGAPGGRRTGDYMSDYVIKGGAFDRAARDLMTRAFTLSWLDRFPPQEPAPEVMAQAGAELAATTKLVELPPPGGRQGNRSNRVKYRCPSCGAQAWGKPNLRLLCGGEPCRLAPLEPVTPGAPVGEREPTVPA
jgi:predicted SprT family Zn-dependent metalloprotease